MANKSKRKSRGKGLTVAVLDDLRGPRKPPRRADGTPATVKVHTAANVTPFRRPADREKP
jgi:hypothetical protein